MAAIFHENFECPGTRGGTAQRTTASAGEKLMAAITIANYYWFYISS